MLGQNSDDRRDAGCANNSSVACGRIQAARGPRICVTCTGVKASSKIGEGGEGNAARLTRRPAALKCSCSSCRGDGDWREDGEKRGWWWRRIFNSATFDAYPVSVASAGSEVEEADRRWLKCKHATRRPCLTAWRVGGIEANGRCHAAKRLACHSEPNIANLAP